MKKEISPQEKIIERVATNGGLYKITLIEKQMNDLRIRIYLLFMAVLMLFIKAFPEINEWITISAVVGIVINAFLVVMNIIEMFKRKY